MAMIGVPLMNNNINPYKKQQLQNKKNPGKIVEKSSPNVDSERRRYQSECVPDSKTPIVKPSRIRYTSENNGNEWTLGQNGRIKSTSSPNLDIVNKKLKVSDHLSLKERTASEANKDAPKRKYSSPITTAIVHLPSIKEEKCPSLTEIPEIASVEDITITKLQDKKTGRRRSLSENAISGVKSAREKRVRNWKGWNPINKLWHQITGNSSSHDAKNENSSNGGTFESSLSNVHQSSCNCIK